MSFPVDVSEYKALSLDPSCGELSAEDKQTLLKNIQIVRDTIVFYTAIGAAKGLGGHTGGAYSIVPEVLIADGFMRGSDSVYPVLFDEAGHRVAIQYAMAAFNGEMPFEDLLHYREYGHGLFGHPELDRDRGIKFSSGRLGHMWPFINGIAMAHPDKKIVMFGSDGSQQEGNNAEAARLAVAKQLEVKLFIDDNNVTISGHPQDYLKGYDVEKTLKGHGLTVDAGDGEDFEASFVKMQKALNTSGPVAVLNRRLMAPGIEGLEGTAKGHDVIPVDLAVSYLESKGHSDAVEYLKNISTPKSDTVYLGSSTEQKKNRDEFGKIISDILLKMTPEERKEKVVVIDSDLEGSCGFHHIGKNVPDVYVHGGIQERGNFSAAAGFGFEKGKQGIFGTFSAFLEMVVSEVTMARLNEANVLAHFSHAGVDFMADNTCHFGVNNFFGASGLMDDDTTRLYFPADLGQMTALINSIFNDAGIRFVFSVRSGVPHILKEDGTSLYGDGYEFVRDKDEVVREGSAGYVVSYGEMLYRSLDAVERARKDGLDVGLINKVTLNTVDEESMERIGKSPFVLVTETQNQLTGLGSRMGTWLLERGLSPKYACMGTVKVGNGGLGEQIDYQGLAPDSILEKIKSLNG